MSRVLSGDEFSVGFTDRAVTAWGGLALLVRLDRTLTRLFGWTCAAECKAIERLFARFDMCTNERVLAESYRWVLGKLASLSRLTLDLESTVVTRKAEQQGATSAPAPSWHPSRLRPAAVP